MLAVGIDRRIVGVCERPIQRRLRRLLRIAPALAIPADVIADLGQDFAVDVLQRQPAVADHLTRLFQAHRPQAESMRAIAVHVPLNPRPDPGLVKRIGIMRHDFLEELTGHHIENKSFEDD